MARRNDAADAAAAAVREAAALLRGADRVIVAAGAGMSIPAGIDYNDEAGFAERYPAIARMGFRCCYEMIGNPVLMRDPALLWGYQAPHSRWMLSTGGDDPTYQGLRRLVGDKPHFVVTTNADGCFVRNGWEQDRVYTPQGSYGKLQCMAGCGHVFDAAPEIARLLPLVDAATQRLRDGTPPPSCPNCGGAVFFNLNGGAWYVNAHWEPARKAFDRFVADAVRAGERVVILELGVGHNTPGVVRWPMEKLAATHESVSLVRVNPAAAGLDRYRVPGARFVSLPVGAEEAVRRLLPGAGPAPGAGAAA